MALAGQPGERASELSVAVNAGWRVQELVLREIVGQIPPRPADVDTRPPVWQRLMEACERIGLRPTEYKAMSVLETPEQLRRAIRPSGSPKTPELLAAAVISADQGAPEHPVRRLAQERSSLLTDLTRASQIRNDGSHAALVRIDLDVVHLRVGWRVRRSPPSSACPRRTTFPRPNPRKDFLTQYEQEQQEQSAE